MIPTPILQSMVSRNRNTITDKHQHIVYYKFLAKDNPTPMNTEFCYSQVDKLTKAIAKLAAAQVALKKELALSIAKQRVAAQCAKVVAGAKASADEVYL